MSEHTATLPDGWWSEMACPACFARFGKDVWMLTTTIGPAERTIKLRYECRTCGYTVPLTADGFETLAA
jgi:hypothetical protein